MIKISYELFAILIASILFIFFFLYRKNKNLQNEIKLEEIIKQLPGHIYWKDKNGICLGSNTNNWKDFGMKSLSDYIGKTDYDFLPKKEAEKLIQIDKEIMNSGESIIIEEYCTTPNGKAALYLSHKVPLRNHDNQIIGILGTSLDITDAKKEHIERLELLENIIALMPGHVYWKDKDCILLGCNDLQAKSAGLSSRKEIIGKTDFDMPWREQADSLRKIDLEIINTGIPKTVEEESRLANGDNAIFLSKKVPLYNENKIIGILGISFDITEQKRVEKELNETRHKLEGMTSVSVNVAHELRTPLASLSVSAENLKEVLPYLLDAYQKAKEANLPVHHIREKYLNSLTETFASMQTEIRSAFTFIDMTLMNVNPAFNETKVELFSISKCIDETLLRYPFNMVQRELIKWNVDPQQDFQVKGEELLVIHVLFNLIKNALYYVAKAGKGDIQIWLEKGKDFNKLYFKDTGTGISKESLPHVFDRFFTQTYHGAGVGLSFCKMAMENMKGKITCDSVEGDYTLFVLSFSSNFV